LRLGRYLAGMCRRVPVADEPSDIIPCLDEGGKEGVTRKLLKLQSVRACIAHGC
jgi:hypothetical protein